MNSISLQLQRVRPGFGVGRTKFIVSALLLLSTGYEIDAISSVMNHRNISSSPLLYKVMDYSEKQLSMEFEPWVSGMFDPDHTMANLSPNGTSTIRLDQLGFGDVNPEWILLGGKNSQANYQSTLHFKPELLMYGLLFHAYKQFQYWYFDVKTALLECQTNIELEEAGGNDGMISINNNQVLYNAYDAFTQIDWQYGKMGRSQRLIGFDDIQITLGSTADMHSFSSDATQTYFSGFGIIQVPTGRGTTAEWLFEPQVGTNHWGVGFGADVLIKSENGFQLTAGGNFRHFIAGWETRSFDLTYNGAWSRYIGIDTIVIHTPGVSTPGINLFTQQALIDGRNQITMYARLEKRFQACLFELSYNYQHAQAEHISQVTRIDQGFGIFDMYASLGGQAVTASHATISQGSAQVVEDPNSPVQLVTSDLNLVSGAAQAVNSSMITARLQRAQEGYTYGVGVSADVAHSAQAISSWSVWANFEILLP